MQSWKAGLISLIILPQLLLSMHPVFEFPSNHKPCKSILYVNQRYLIMETNLPVYYLWPLDSLRLYPWFICHLSPQLALLCCPGPVSPGCFRKGISSEHFGFVQETATATNAHLSWRTGGTVPATHTATFWPLVLGEKEAIAVLMLWWGTSPAALSHWALWKLCSPLCFFIPL